MSTPEKEGRVPEQTSPSRRSEAGFTLVEALVAIVVLVFGLMAVTNLLLLAGSSNTVANQSSAATAMASQVMEDLRSISFEALAAGGGLTGACGTPTGTPPAAFCRTDTVVGVGIVQTWWQITAVNPNTLYIVVRSEGTGSLAGTRSRAEFTSFRTCTAAAPACPQ
jgi:Tfp pilus assembly protein PilV